MFISLYSWSCFGVRTAQHFGDRIIDLVSHSCAFSDYDCFEILPGNDEISEEVFKILNL